MGAQESKGTGQGENTASDVPDYYQILEVSEEATADEIRKSFRRLAIIHHPDKNPNDIEAATKKFASMQQAYEVLSDEQERAWYDSHRASLVPEPEASAVYEDIRNGATPLRKRMNDPGLSVNHILRFMDPSGWSSMDDSPHGFFSTNRNLFARLTADEATWQTESAFSYPSFGYSSWPWMPADKEHEGEAARTFYNAWLSFSTEKDFAWKDHYNVNEAPDRRVRRLMEKENKKAREDARREYNDTVRSLVRFIRKRDPRYKTHLAEQARSSAKGNAASKQIDKEAAQKRNEAGVLYVDQAWQRTNAVDASAKAHEEWGDAEWEGAEGTEEYECVACRKSFRSEQAWTNHERSRKHLKEVERLMQEMRLENQELGLENVDVDDDPLEPEEEHENDAVESRKPDPESGNALSTYMSENDNDFTGAMSSKKRKNKGKKGVTVDATAGNDDLDPNGLLDARRNQGGEEVQHQEDVKASVKDEAPESVSKPPELSKREKRRAKELAKKEKRADQICNVCHEEFESRTKLFLHVRETGHAAPQSDNKTQDDLPAKGEQHKTRGGKKSRK